MSYRIALDTGNVKFSGYAEIHISADGSTFRTTGQRLTPRRGVFVYRAPKDIHVRLGPVSVSPFSIRYEPVAFAANTAATKPLGSPVVIPSPEEAAAANGGMISLPAGVGLTNTQRADGTWTLDKTIIDASRAGGTTVTWVTDAAVNLPPSPTRDGLTDGDVIDGVAIGEGYPDVPPAPPAPMTVVLSDKPTDASWTTTFTATEGPVLDAFAGGSTTAEWRGGHVLGESGHRARRYNAAPGAAALEVYSNGYMEATTPLSSGEIEIEFDLFRVLQAQGGWFELTGDPSTTQHTRVGHIFADNGTVSFRYESAQDGITTVATAVSGVPATEWGKVIYRWGPSGFTVTYNGTEVARVENAFQPTDRFRPYAPRYNAMTFRNLIVRKATS